MSRDLRLAPRGWVCEPDVTSPVSTAGLDDTRHTDTVLCLVETPLRSSLLRSIGSGTVMDTLKVVLSVRHSESKG